MHGGRENKVKKETKQRAVPYFEQKKEGIRLIIQQKVRIVSLKKQMEHLLI